MRRSAATAAVALLGCTQTLVLDVQLLNPCNQQAIGAVDFLRIEPRGRDVDSVGLTTVHRVADNGTGPLPIPGSDDFQIIATGHRGEFSTPPAAIGVSVRFDLSAAEDGFRVPVPFGLVDTFYKTTDLADPASCSTLRVPRYGATATFLPENGRVLVLGGATLRDGAIEFRRAIELYDPATGRFDIVAELRAGGARAFHTATLLADGTVLVTGGEDCKNDPEEPATVLAALEAGSLCRHSFVVAIGGGISAAGDVLLNPIVEATKAESLEGMFEHTKIVPATLGNDAGSLGAAFLVL